jgi:catechol 2,3-dioxygenase-like lactoylglutathione lyase family enzyme
MKPNLTHIALQVEKFDQCRLFYQDYCGMKLLHQRESHGQRVLWMSEDGREKSLILVLLEGGHYREPAQGDYSHLGFALESRQAVNRIADKARRDGCLIWEPLDNPYPVGYYCGVRDPQGNSIEFSYGQPLGPGAE